MATWFFLMFEFVKNNLTFCTNCFNSAGKVFLERFLHDTTFELLLGVVSEVAGSKKIPEKDLSFIENFYTLDKLWCQENPTNGIVINSIYD